MAADITQLATEPLPPEAGDRVASGMDAEGQEECTEEEITHDVVAREETSATAVVPCSDSADEPTADTLCVAGDVGGGGGTGGGKEVGGWISPDDA